MNLQFRSPRISKVFRLAATSFLGSLLILASRGFPAYSDTLVCGSSSISSYSGTYSITVTASDPVSACSTALATVQGAMLFFSFSSCSPCLGTGCDLGLTNLSNSIQVVGPDETSPGSWDCTASFSGTYHVSCSLCDIFPGEK